MFGLGPQIVVQAIQGEHLAIIAGGAGQIQADVALVDQAAAIGGAIEAMQEFADQESRIRAREAAKKAFAAGMKNGILYMENPEQTIYVDEYLSSNGLAENENNLNEK